jgi:hypothetical protein
LSRVVEVSIGYEPRPWQARQHAAMARARYSVLVVHRRGGKTVLAVNAVIDAALRHTGRDGRFAYLAPLLTQAREIAWDYLRRFTAAIPGTEVHESRLEVKLPNGSRIRLFGADNPDALRGIYLDGVVLDEVAQMRPEVWGEIIRPALSDRRGWALFIGTPKGVNLFSELYHKALGAPEWHAAKLTYLDTGAIAPAEIEAARATMTEAQFAQEFLCDFEAGAEDQLIALSTAIEAAKRAPKEPEYSWAPKVLGVDVARYGDDRTVIFLRQGIAAFRPWVLRDLSTIEVANHVALVLQEHDVAAVFIDVGGVGAGVYDYLHAHGHPVRPVDFGGRPTNPRFLNKRCEIWWSMAEWIKTGAIPDDTDLIRDLCAPKYDYKRPDGKLKLESKDDLRERGMPSPDLADALAMTFASPIAPTAALQPLPWGMQAPQRGMTLHNPHPHEGM